MFAAITTGAHLFTDSRALRLNRTLVISGVMDTQLPGFRALLGVSKVAGLGIILLPRELVHKLSEVLEGSFSRVEPL